MAENISPNPGIIRPRTVLGELNSNLLRSTDASRGKRTPKYSPQRNKLALKAGAVVNVPQQEAEKPRKRRRHVAVQFSPPPEQCAFASEIKDLEADNSAYQLQVAELQDEKDEQLRKIRRLEEEVLGKDSALNSLSEELSRGHAEMDDIRKDFTLCQQRAKQAAASAMVCIESLETEKAEAEDASLVLQTSVRALESRVRELDDERRAANREASAMLEAVKQASESLENVERQARQLRSENESLDFRNNELIVQLEQTRSELYSRTRELCEERTASIRAAFANLRSRPPPPPPSPSPNAGNCSICLEALSGTSCSATGCGHVFHSNCLQRSMEGSTRCPTCRTFCTTATNRLLFL